MIGELTKQAAEQGTQKAEAKRWAVIEQPLQLADALARLTKDELGAVRVSLGLAKQSSLKKQDLVDLSAEQLPSALAEAAAHTEEQAIVSALKQLIQGKGLLLAEALTEEVIDALTGAGYAFPSLVNGDKALVMPLEVLQALSALGQFQQADAGGAGAGVPAAGSSAAPSENRQHAEWAALTRGMLYYYGTLSKVKLHSLVEQYTKQTIPSADYYSVLMEEVSRGALQHDETHGLSAPGVADAARIAQEHKVSSEVPLYPFSKQQLLEAGAEGFVDQNRGYKSFIAFLMDHWSMGAVEAAAVANSVVASIQERAGLQDIAASLQEQLDVQGMQELEALVERVVELMNHTRQWTLKGHSPSDLAARREAAMKALAGGSVPKRTSPNVQVHVAQKVGRNEPCTCGSGKKYKKCCGAN